MGAPLKGRHFRCYTERVDEHHWEAFCVDLPLAARGASLHEARTNLDGHMLNYVASALGDPERFDILLSQKAPFLERVYYVRLAIKEWVGKSLRRGRPSVPPMTEIYLRSGWCYRNGDGRSMPA